MIPSENLPEAPPLAVPRRSVLVATVVVYLVVTAALLVLLAGRASGLVQAGLDVAALLVTTALAAIFTFRHYQLPLETAQYVVEDQALQLSRYAEAVVPRTPAVAEFSALEAARKEVARLGEELKAARKALEDQRLELKLAPKVFAPIAIDQPAANRDALTGLQCGVMAFEQRIGELIADTQRNGSFHGVLMIGLDHLEKLLDEVGPVASEEYIWTVAQLITEHAGAKDLFRVSSKHFGLLLPGAGDKEIVSMAQRIIGAVAAREFSWGTKTHIGAVSVGAVSIGLSDVSARDILERAIHAHGHAQLGGGEPFHMEAMLPMLEKRAHEKSVRDWLESRLDHQHQRLAAQAIVAVDGKAVDASWHELLLRIEDDDGAWLPPEHYVDVLERLQITNRIDQWVMQTALRKSPPAAGAARRLSINIFGSSLARESFIADLRELLATSAWPTTQICFEIDESTVMQRPSRVAAFIGVAAEFGCQFAIDRYRGVAGLAALRNFPVNYIKLHDSLLVSRSADIVDRAQLEWLVHSAHLCGAKVVAVGIRDEDMLARARELKVDFVQGFALAPPSPWGD